MHIRDLREKEVTMDQVDKVILLFLSNIYHLVSALPNALAFDALEGLMAHSGFLQPFVGGAGQVDGTLVLRLGIPSEESHHKLCDSYRELIRLAGAAVVCFYHYTNFAAHPRVFPSDDALLLFATMAIHSCVDAGAAAALGPQLEAAGSPISLGQLRWLMHWLRAQFMMLAGTVRHALGDDRGFKDHLMAQQADLLSCLKAAPENPAGYVMYVRSCLQFQQLSAAALFAEKGAVVAEKHNAQVYLGQLRAMRAVALALGAGGRSAGDAVLGAAAAAAATGTEVDTAAVAEGAAAGGTVASFRAGDVRALTAGALAAVEAERQALPEVYRGMVGLGQDQYILEQKVSPLLEGVADDGARVAALTGFMYATQPPRELPRGAMAVEVGGDEGEEAAGAPRAAAGGQGRGAGRARAGGRGGRGRKGGR